MRTIITVETIQTQKGAGERRRQNNVEFSPAERRANKDLPIKWNGCKALKVRKNSFLLLLNTLTYEIPKVKFSNADK